MNGVDDEFADAAFAAADSVLRKLRKVGTNNRVRISEYERQLDEIEAVEKSTSTEWS